MRLGSGRAQRLALQWVPGVNAAASTVVASAATIANDGVASCSVTITLLDVNGSPLVGYQPQLTVTPTTGNTVTQPGVTNASGVATGSFVSTHAEAKTISVGLGIATASCTVTSSSSDVTTFASLTPTVGSAAGGLTVTLTVTGATNPPAITFGGVAATGVSVVNSTTVTCVTPAVAASVVDVVCGTHTLAASYTYLATPSILANASFEVGDSPSQWDAFTNWGSGGDPDQGAVLDNTLAYVGSSSAKFPITVNPGGDTGARFSYQFTAADRVFCRLAFKLSVKVSSIMKFVRFYDAGLNHALGGIWLAQNGGGSAGGNGMVCVGWDQEDPGIVTTIGLTEAQVIDGNWHLLEIDWQRNGGSTGYPEAAFWFDGAPQYAELNGHTTVKYYGSGNNSTWVNGRINAGERVVSYQMANLALVPTLNAANTTTGQINMDHIALSASRIGP